MSHEAVEDDDQQNVDEDIYEECGEGDGDLQQVDNVMNDECKCHCKFHFYFYFGLSKPSK